MRKYISLVWTILLLLTCCGCSAEDTRDNEPVKITIAVDIREPYMIEQLEKDAKFLYPELDIDLIFLDYNDEDTGAKAMVAASALS